MKRLVIQSWLHQTTYLKYELEDRIRVLIVYDSNQRQILDYRRVCMNAVEIRNFPLPEAIIKEFSVSFYNNKKVHFKKSIELEGYSTEYTL